MGQGTPTSGRHSGPQGRGRFVAVRLHGAQARGPQRCQRCLPLEGTDHGKPWDSRREGTTSELGVLPAARLRRAVPTRGRRSRAAVTTLHLRRSASASFHARRGVQANPIMRVSPGGGRHRCAKRSERRGPRSRLDDAERRVPAERNSLNHPRTRGPSLPPACGGLCRPEVGVPWPARRQGKQLLASFAPLRGAVPV